MMKRRTTTFVVLAVLVGAALAFLLWDPCVDVTVGGVTVCVRDGWVIR